MPTKAELYAQMAEKVTTQLTGSWQEWAGFLTTAARLYKYPFHEQLMIYAQRPDATACAEYDLWNEKMGRYVRRGSKGIALVDDSGDRPRLRYVFDISDTGTREHSRTPWLWQLEERYLDSVQAMLERTYDVSGDDLAGQLTEVAGKLAEEYWTEHQQDFFYIVDGSFLEEYDEFNIGVQFKAAATVSITYALMSRCGLEPERYFDHEDFMAIFDFNTPSTIGALGTAVSQINQQVLRQIGVTVRNAEREANQERSKQDEQSHDLYPERRLSDSRPEAEPAAGETPGQVRKDEENLPEGTPSHPLQPDVAEREAVPAPSGDRRDRPEQTGADDAPAGEGSGSHRGTESQRSHEVGGADEHLQSPSRGDPDVGAYQQLTLNLFLSEAEQIQSIDEAENVAHTSSAFSFAQNDIDHVLRLGGNTDRQRERVVAAFEKQKTTSEIAEILKTLYHGGNGLGSVSAWYAEDGIHLSHGKSVRYDRSAQVISWESAAERIGELLESGQFASNVELAEAAGYERSLLSEKLWYLYHDFSEEAREAGYLSCLSKIKGNGFPEETRRLTEQLSDPDFRQTLKEEYAAFWTAYQQDRDLLRFHYHRPREIWENLKDLDLPRRTFSSDLSQVPTVQHFITEDEIDAAMTGGSSFAGGKGRIYAFFMANHTDKEKVRFLKDEYGIGGRSHALSGATHSGEDHDGKGLHYKKQDCPDVHLNWEKVAKRITSLVQKDRYLTEQEQAQYDKIQSEQELAEEDAIQAQQPEMEEEAPKPILREQFEQYKPVVTAAISEDAAYRNACGHSDRENAVIEGNAAVRRAVLGSKDMELIRLYSDVPEFRQRLHREVIDETYPKLHELLRPLSQEDIDTALCAWNGNIESKHAVVRYMKDHEREKDTAAWLAQEYGGSNSNSLFVVRAGSPEETQLPWPKVQRRIAQLIQEDRFYTEEEQNRFDDIDPIAIREALEERGIVNGQVADPEKLDNDPFIQQVMSDAEQIADAETEQTSEVSISDEEYDAVRRPIPQRTSYDPAAPVYAVGDTVYIEDDAYQITELREDTVQLLPTGMVYPIYRAERKEQFEQLLRADRRNAYYTEFLPIDPNKADQDLRDVLVHGLMDEADKQQISTLLQSGRSNSEIAYWLSRAYSGEIETLNLETGDIADYRTTAQGMELEVLDAEEKRLAVLYFRWDEVAPLLRGMYARQLDGFGQERPEPAVESPTFHSETVAVYPGDKNNLPYDVVVERLHIEEPEPPAPVTEPEKTFEEVLDEHPVSIQVNGQWQTFPNAKAAEEASYEEYKANLRHNAQNFRITDEHLGEGGPKAKFQANIEAIKLLKYLEETTAQATPEQQEVLSRYVGWGGLADAFDPEKPAWASEYAQLKELLTPEEYAAARSSTLNAHYTSPTVIQAIYEAVDRMGFETGNILDPNVKNYSYAIVDGQVYYRENSRMVRPDLNATAEARVKGLVGLRDCVQELIDLQMDAAVPDSTITQKQAELNSLYDGFSAKYGLINDRANRLAYADDSSYYLLCALEVIDEDGKLERKADMFTKRTIKPHQAVAVVDTASEALAVSISEKACVDMSYMSQLTGKTKEELAGELQGVIFRVPGQLEKDGTPHYVTADEYLSGNVRHKLRQAQRAAQQYPVYAVNVEALTAAQPKDLDASEIEVRLGATWIDKEYIQQFMYETFNTPFYLQRSIEVNYSSFTAEWQIKGKSSVSYNDVAAYTTYGTSRANAYKILEDSLNLRDVRIYDTIEDADGKERRVLNAKETTLAAQKQQAIREAFRDWIWRDPERRQTLVRQYNEEMNSTRPREYDGSHITFGGMNPAITLREHQKSAIAHVLYGGNTLLAHEVGAGKTFEMVAAAMEAKRLGLCQKSLFVVPNHLTEQWASEFLRLYPSANILVTTKKDFETHNRKKFCARIATGDYDAIIMGHSQFERIPISRERQEGLLYEQIDEITEGIAEVQASGGERFTVKQLERTRKSLEARLEKLQAEGRKDDVVTFEQLGVDRLFVDEAHNYKNLFLYTKMRNVAGLSTSDAQKSSDMFAKCRYMDEITGNRGVIFATGTPVSNSMTELYTMQRYLQYERLQELNMIHFDCWASRFGETVTALELAPEGTGYRARTRFSKFFNLPELMNLFKEVADIKTADQLNLPTPEVEYHNIVAQPTEHQQEMVKALSERASLVHSGTVDPSQDNMLKITSDGRKLGLDQRIVNQMLPDEPCTKVNQCVDNIMQIWRDGEADKLTQLVFCDISTPQAKAPASKAAKTLDNPLLHALEGAVPLPEQEPAFTVYDDIRQKLIAQGMPADQIAFIHEANTEVRKKELFSKVRTGQVRVLMGSTAKMGAGTNVQDRLVALHDLDCPWRPGDLAQRKGRIERQGNQNPLVHVYRYVTEGTFDAYLWQTVENKQKFISQIMTSKSPVRSCDDVDETALSFAEIKALCAGDPRIKERMDLDVEVSRLKLMKADHQSKQYRLEDQLLKYFPEEIEKHKGFIKGFESDLEVLAAHPHPEDGFAGMEIRGDLLTDKENAGAALLDACKEVKTSDPVQIGSYRGYAMSVEFSAWKQEYTLLLKGQMTHRATLGTDPRGNLTRIDNALAQMPQRLEAAKAQLDNLYQQQAAAKEEVGKPFLYEEELRSKNARLVELDTLLNIDGKGPAHAEAVVAKSTRPSVLDHLKRPVPPRSTDKKPKQHEEVR